MGAPLAQLASFLRVIRRVSLASFSFVCVSLASFLRVFHRVSLASARRVWSTDRQGWARAGKERRFGI